MVTDESVTKVVMICDRVYAAKANLRTGGVGTESQIISPKIYGSQKQSKFVAVVSERDETGKPYLPTYYSSHTYIDLSSSQLYQDNFEQLIRWVHDKPLHVMPNVGQRPAFLDEQPHHMLGTALFHRRAIEAIRSSSPSRSGAVTEYFARLKAGLEEFRISGHADDFDEMVVASVAAMRPYRDEAVSIFSALATHGYSTEDTRIVLRALESFIPLCFQKASSGATYAWDQDNFKFLVHELFLYAIATALASEQFETVGDLLRSEYYVGNLVGEHGTRPFTIFNRDIGSLRLQDQKQQRLSVRADMLKARCVGVQVTFEQLMQADLLIYTKDALSALRGAGGQTWEPFTLLFSTSINHPFEVFARSKSLTYCRSLLSALDIESPNDLRALMPAIGSGKIRLPQWRFDTAPIDRLLGLEALGTSA